MQRYQQRNILKATIVISNYQSIEFLPKCLYHLMNQTYKNFEVIFVDAGSTDGSPEYVQKYFTEINSLFAKFGSKNFTLEKEEDNRGHLPVYSLKVKFHNKEIVNDQLCTVLSESDRRAMALAIFFAIFPL